MTDRKHKIVEVAAGVLQRGTPVQTLAVRKASGQAAGSWEFPGGKRESHESLSECLHRELTEELCINVRVGNYIGVCEYYTSAVVIHLHAFFIKEWGGRLTLNEHDAAVWLPHDQLFSLNWCPADIPLVDRIKQLPYNS